MNDRALKARRVIAGGGAILVCGHRRDTGNCRARKLAIRQLLRPIDCPGNERRGLDSAGTSRHSQSSRRRPEVVALHPLAVVCLQCVLGSGGKGCVAEYEAYNKLDGRQWKRLTRRGERAPLKVENAPSIMGLS